jgi:hypothetical protein
MHMLHTVWSGSALLSSQVAMTENRHQAIFCGANSLSEERTMSDMTLVDSALGNRQGAQTQVDQVQIRQHYRSQTSKVSFG